MSDRRAKTVSPLIGWPSKASPAAVQSLSVPSSKSRFKARPSADIGLIGLPPSASGAASDPCGPAHANPVAITKTVQQLRWFMPKTPSGSFPRAALNPQAELQLGNVPAPKGEANSNDRQKRRHPLNGWKDDPFTDSTGVPRYDEAPAGLI